MRFEQPEDQVTVRPDVPGAELRRAVPALRLRRLLAHEASLRRVVPEVPVGRLKSDEVVRDTSDSIEQRGIARARGCLRSRIQPLTSMLAVPIAAKIRVRVCWREDCDRRTRLIDDELRKTTAMIRSQRLAENAAELNGVRWSELQRALACLHRRCCSLRHHAASTTQRKPMPPERSLHGAISRYLPC